MTRVTAQIVDADLHAFADNCLPADRRASLLVALEADTAEGRRVADWCSQNEAIRRILGKTAFEPVPVALSLAGTSRRQGDAAASPSAVEKAAPRLVEPAIPQLPKPRRRRSRTLGRVLALATVIGAAGVFGMASGRRGVQPTPQTAAHTDSSLAGPAEASLAAFSSRAIEAHRTFALDSQLPVEIASGQLPRLVQWFERRLGQSVTIPDLRTAGFALLGGRLVPGPRNPSALLIYQNAGGERLGLLFAKGETGNGHAMVYRSGQGTGAVTWSQGGDLLSLTGAPEPSRLTAAAKLAASGFKASDRR